MICTHPAVRNVAQPVNILPAHIARSSTDSLFLRRYVS
jgi:hypothetical protein